MHKEFVEKFQHHRGQKNDVLVTVKETKYLGQNMLYMPTPKLEHESVQVKAKVSHIFDNLVYDLSPTGMSHLSLSKNVKTCLEVQQKPASTSLLESKVLKELCPRSKEIFVPKEEETSSQGISQEGHKNRADVLQKDGHTSQSKNVQERQLNNISCPKKKIILQVVEAIKNVEIVSGCKEESFKEIPLDTLLMLGESASKIANNESTRSYTVLRSKPCQEGGDVVVLKSVVQPESHQTSQTGHLGDTSDKQSVQGVYLNNKKEFVYETNFTRSRTHKGVIEASNFKRSFTDQKVMNFTSQRFLSPSICEYPTLEGDSGPRKERPDTLEIGPCYCQVNSGNCNI
ncbi:hypothetical protein DY000_02058516 [Brassica cretica]|uniref:Protein WAVE n=1 Tax=Brassica cretica TaxID=69181 RepID=A0ABQ7AZZ2_BRACR|nr:hypothetical protein DY000_02058516 [Brassica cretica]